MLLKGFSDMKKESAYLALYRQLRDAITSGLYPYGSRLPSKRVQSEESGVSVITVEHAYALLEEEGYIEARERSGYFVIYRKDYVFPVAGVLTSEGADMHSADRHTVFHPGGRNTGSRLTDRDTGPRLSDRDTGPHSNDRDTGSHSTGRDTDSVLQDGAVSVAPPLPFTTYARAMRKVIADYGDQILTKCDNEGLPVLREELAAYLARSRGITVSPDRILIGAGAEYLYSLVVQMLGRDKIYGLEDPSYEKIRLVYEANGAACRMLTMGFEGIRSDKLHRTDAQVLHVTPFHSYPSGVTASASKRREYLEWARARSAMIVEDDFDSEFSLLSKAVDTLFSQDPDRSVIYINTFSRSIAPSMRLGYMILPSETAESLRERIRFYSCTVPVFEQYVLAEFIRSGEFERHINRVRRQIRRGE